MEQHQTFRPDPTNVACARRFVGGAFAEWGLDSSDACLLTSELVTNAVMHGRTDVTVTVKLVDRRVRVEVMDFNPRLPSVRPLSPDDTAGRGLYLLQRVARAWGVESNPVQKSVWFEVACQQAG